MHRYHDMWNGKVFEAITSRDTRKNDAKQLKQAGKIFK